MKKILVLLAAGVALGAGLVGSVPKQAAPTVSASAGTEAITSFDVTATLDSERHLVVREQIRYDFGANQRHGIIREIPESYTREGMAYNYRYSVRSVQRDGQDEPYSEQHGGNMMTLKIGRADRTMGGVHTYVIEYESDKAINFFSDHSELYWNVTGNGWPVSIGAASFKLVSPLKDKEPQRFVCYTGILGSQEQACALKAADGVLTVSATRVLDPTEGLTVVFAFAPGLIREPTTAELVWGAIKDNLILLVPLVALAIMFWVWRTRGKDLPPQTVVPQYEAPRGMAPLVLSAALGDGAIPQRGVTATLIDMARKGQLHIAYGQDKGLFGTTQTYTFIKKNQPAADALSWETILWNGLFDDGKRDQSTFQELKDDRFYLDVQAAVAKATRVLQALRIFDANPYLVRGLYIAAAILAAVVVRLIGAFSPAAGLAMVATFVVVAVFGWFMPRRTKEGVDIVAEVKGFKWFLSVTEEERLKFHNAPARTPEQFMSLLPAAIALGVEKEWAEQFKSLQIPPPDWAEGDVQAWNAVAIAAAVSSLNSASASSVYNAPSSAGAGGSGFSGGGSGGGGGGGGGGSW